MQQQNDNSAESWTVSFKNSRVEKAWHELSEKAPENMKRCEEHLETKPMGRIPGRVFPLMGKKYKGSWEYEVTGADRVFYVPDPDTKTVLVYYAGKHVKPAPLPL
jgi:mRNA-degrading endonuclease RelE of RelBE toxin-antitoxin system